MSKPQNALTIEASQAWRVGLAESSSLGAIGQFGPTQFVVRI